MAVSSLSKRFPPVLTAEDYCFEAPKAKAVLLRLLITTNNSPSIPGLLNGRHPMLGTVLGCLLSHHDITLLRCPGRALEFAGALRRASRTLS